MTGGSHDVIRSTSGMLQIMGLSATYLTVRQNLDFFFLINKCTKIVFSRHEGAERSCIDTYQCCPPSIVLSGAYVLRVFACVLGLPKSDVS